MYRSLQCQFLYLHDYFFQNRFDSRQRYQFEDKILVNLKDLGQHVDLVFEGHQQLKVVVTEAYGINVKMILMRGDTPLKESSKAGSMEILHVPDMYEHSNKGKNNEYKLVF